MENTTDHEIDYFVYVGFASNTIVFILAVLFSSSLLIDIHKCRSAIVVINSLGFYTHSQNDEMFRLRTTLYRNTILLLVAVTKGIHCIILIILIYIERYVPHSFWEDLHIELECRSFLESFPYISNQNLVTASIEGLLYSITCMLFLFFAILMSYYVKVYDEQINPALLSYRREYFLSICAVVQVIVIWGLHSVYLVGRLAGCIVAICITIDFLVLLYFVSRLRCSIKQGISTSYGETKVNNILHYREYLCISSVLVTSIIIYSFGIMLAISAQWYLVVFGNDCKWLIGIFYNLETTTVMFPEFNLLISFFKYLTIAFLITVIQFDITLISIATLFAIFSLLKKCKRGTKEAKSFLLEAETTLASSEYTISGNRWYFLSSNNESGSLSTAV